MSQRVVIPLVAVVAFGAGYGAHVWVQHDPALPPPPTPGSEFVRPGAAADPKTEAKPASSGVDRAKLISELQKVGPQADAYRKRLDEIATEFDRDFQTLLTAEQHVRYDANQKKNAEGRAKHEAKEAAETGPLSDQQIEQLRRQPLWNALWNVSVNARLDRLKNEYKLDAGQQARTLALLNQRREKFLALIDSTPPPTISYSDLARRAQKLGEPAKK